MSHESIIMDKEGAVARITINRPPLNILDAQTLRELSKALVTIRADEDSKIAVISGAGEKAFSAGVKIEDHLPDRIEETLQCFHKIFHLLTDIEKPTMAVVRGFAFGGGCELASACDIVLASKSSEFGQQEIKVGAIPTVATVLLPRIVGRRKAMELILTGDTITALEAKRIGLVNEVFDPDELDKGVDRFLMKISEKSSVVLRLVRKSVYHTLDRGLAEALDGVTKIYLTELMKTYDAVEGLEAFLEKRKPIWKNR